MNLKINPKKKELEEILTLYKKKQFTEGEIKIKKLIDVYSKSFSLYNLLGVFLNEKNKIDWNARENKLQEIADEAKLKALSAEPPVCQWSRTK